MARKMTATPTNAGESRRNRCRTTSVNPPPVPSSPSSAVPNSSSSWSCCSWMAGTIRNTKDMTKRPIMIRGRSSSKEKRSPLTLNHMYATMKTPPAARETRRAMIAVNPKSLSEGRVSVVPSTSPSAGSKVGKLSRLKIRFTVATIAMKAMARARKLTLALVVAAIVLKLPRAYIYRPGEANPIRTDACPQEPSSSPL